MELNAINELSMDTVGDHDGHWNGVTGAVHSKKLYSELILGLWLMGSGRVMNRVVVILGFRFSI